MTNKQIRQLYNNGKTINQLCQMAGLSKARVLMIIKGK